MGLVRLKQLVIDG